MIRVTVELDRYGLGEHITKLAEVRIINEGNGTATHGNYTVLSLRKGSFYGKAQRSARVENHARQREHVLVLVRKALEAMGY